MIQIDETTVSAVNDTTKEALAAAMKYADEKGGKLQESMTMCIVHINGLAKNVGRVRISANGFGFFDLMVERKALDGTWVRILDAGLVARDLHEKEGQIVRGPNAEWSLHS